MEYLKALRIIKTNLQKKGLKVNEEGSNIIIEGVCLDITSQVWAFEADWTTGNICLKTVEYNINCNHKRKRILNFNILSGNYNKLITKIKELQQENARIEKENKEENIEKQERKEEIKKIFKNYDFIENYGMIEIETPYFGISINPDNNNIRIQANVDLDYIQTIKLLTKLGITKGEK